MDRLIDFPHFRHDLTSVIWNFVPVVHSGT